MSNIRDQLAALLGASAGLGAIAIAVLLVLPALVQALSATMPRYSAQSTTRTLRTIARVMMASVLFLMLASLAAVVGVFYPSSGLAYACGGIVATGTALLGAGTLWFAVMLDRRAM